MAAVTASSAHSAQLAGREGSALCGAYPQKNKPLEIPPANSSPMCGASEFYYPVFLELGDRACLVIGGGPVAERKVAGLLHVRARVTVISPTLTASLEEWDIEGQIRHVARIYRAGDLFGYQLAFVTTGDRQVNSTVCREGRALGILVNAADDPAHYDFILPAVVRRGPLAVAIATGGTSPALAGVIRTELDAYLGPDYATLAELSADARCELRRRGQSATGEVWQAALGNSTLRQLVREGRQQEAKTQLMEQLGVA